MNGLKVIENNIGSQMICDMVNRALNSPIQSEEIGNIEVLTNTNSKPKRQRNVKKPTIEMLAGEIGLKVNEENLQLIREKVLLLEPKLRAALELVYGIFEKNNLKREDIAIRLGIKNPGLWAREKKGIKRLKEKIENNDNTQDIEIIKAKPLRNHNMEVLLKEVLHREMEEQNIELVKKSIGGLRKDLKEYFELRFKIYKDNNLTRRQILTILGKSETDFSNYEKRAVEKLNEKIEEILNPDSIKELKAKLPKLTIEDLAQELRMKGTEENILLIKEKVALLNTTWKRYFELAFRIYEDNDFTKEEIAKEIGVTADYLRQLKRVALKRLKHKILTGDKSKDKDFPKAVRMDNPSIKDLLSKVGLEHNNKNMELLLAAIDKLSYNKKKYLYLRYKIDGDNNLTLQEIADKLDVKKSSLKGMDRDAISQLMGYINGTKKVRKPTAQRINKTNVVKEKLYLEDQTKSNIIENEKEKITTEKIPENRIEIVNETKAEPEERLHAEVQAKPVAINNDRTKRVNKIIFRTTQTNKSQELPKKGVALKVHSKSDDKVSKTNKNVPEMEEYLMKNDIEILDGKQSGERYLNDMLRVTGQQMETPTNIEGYKRLVESYKDMSVTIIEKLGRERKLEYTATIEGMYPVVFTLKYKDNRGNTKRKSFSYADLLTERITIKLE